MESQSSGVKDPCQKVVQIGDHFRELCKDQYALTLFIDGLADITQHGEFPAVFFVITFLAHILIRVIADLFQFHYGRKYDPPALEIAHRFWTFILFLQDFLQFLYIFFVQDGLLFGKLHIVHLLQFVRQIGDDGFVCFDTPQHKG